MNTPTHLMVGAALFARPGLRARGLAALSGALAPDAAIYVLWAGGRLLGHGERVIWSDLYFSPTWQAITTIGNSAPLYASIALIGAWRRQPVLWIFALAALAHLALDFPVHAGDAHAHFWPLTDWRFESPLSYWDPAHYGRLVLLAEVVFGLVLAGLLWRRFASRWVRGALVVAVSLYLAVPVYFMLAI